MYAEQQREIKLGRRKRVNWIPIAKSCIAGFDRMIRSEYVRRRKLDTLRDAVYARRRAKSANMSRRVQ
jgi:hypothetical protein